MVRSWHASPSARPPSAWGPGRYTKFSYSGWKDTTGIRSAGFTQSQLNLTMLKIPAQAAEEVSVAAKASWPLHFEGTRYTGN